MTIYIQSARMSDFWVSYIQVSQSRWVQLHGNKHIAIDSDSVVSSAVLTTSKLGNAASVCPFFAHSATLYFSYVEW